MEWLDGRVNELKACKRIDTRQRKCTCINEEKSNKPERVIFELGDELLAAIIGFILSFSEHFVQTLLTFHLSYTVITDSGGTLFVESYQSP